MRHDNHLCSLSYPEESAAAIYVILALAIGEVPGKAINMVKAFPFSVKSESLLESPTKFGGTNSH